MNAENIFINREISWLDFNARVLQEAQDSTVPLIERLRFIGIFSHNLDEFFKVRYATNKRIALDGSEKEKLSAEKILEEINKKTLQLQHDSLFVLNTIIDELSKENIYVVDETGLDQSQKVFVNQYFLDIVSPALLTTMLNDVEDIPYIKDNHSYLAVRMELDHTSHPKLEPLQYSLIEISPELNRFVVLPSTTDNKYVIMIDDIIRYELATIFSIFNTISIEAHMFKFTRDAELDIDDDLSKSFLKKIEESVKDRLDADPVRFVYDKQIGVDTLQTLLDKMNIGNRDSITPGGRYHNRRDYMNFPSLGRKDLLYSPIIPLKIPGLTLEGSILEQIAKKDYLLNTPYQTFGYIVRFLREAALDPNVRNVFITIYRLSKISHVASSLIQAARNGKRVTVQIELQARFDETANIKYAEQMEKEGIHLIFGIPGLKVHSKICLIQRIEQDKIVRYGFISTGNFNESTAKIYTDFTLFTADQKLLKEVGKVFKFLKVNYKVYKYHHLINSPHDTLMGFKNLIAQEIKNHKDGKKASIRIKINNITNYKIIEALYDASRAGVKVQMIVRGICCLVPGVEGMSENIEVVSIIDKFLEHPRLMIFENAGNPSVYISSADWMTRNIQNRVEVSCPIYDKEIKKEIIEVFEIGWKDNVKSRLVGREGKNLYKTDSNQLKVRSQFETYNYFKHKLEL